MLGAQARAPVTHFELVLPKDAAASGLGALAVPDDVFATDNV